MRLSDLQAYYYDSGLLNRNVSGAGDGLSAVVPRGLPNPWINPFQITRSEFRPLVAAVLAETVLYGIHIVLNRHRHHHRHHSHNTDNRSPLPSGGSAVIVNDRHIDMTSRRRLRDYIPNFLKLQTRLRIRISLQLISFLAATIMFILATADIGVSYSIILNHYGNYVDGLENTQDFLTMVYPKILIHLVNNVIADALLVNLSSTSVSQVRTDERKGAFLLLAGTDEPFVDSSTRPLIYVELSDEAIERARASREHNDCGNGRGRQHSLQQRPGIHGTRPFDPDLTPLSYMQQEAYTALLAAVNKMTIGEISALPPRLQDNAWKIRVIIGMQLETMACAALHDEPEANII
ncbi:hypothetical protein D9756_007221 [Leucocoprinus leucothites]|uniref:Uncharacterized protein n=1 Tax=Leucocoprinus leucothites TaxID=201217 RepID=A0A8H5D6D4_9AGAR|nr:hypothetical protein D9756_007221 [Leucoagaricus leucothites]